MRDHKHISGFFVFLAFSFYGQTYAQEITVSGAATGEVDVYVAEEGDTLWDIAERFFRDPWYWPILWSFNPHITNPNWIFPGDLVYLVPPKPVPTRKEPWVIQESRYSVGPQIEEALARRIGFISKETYEGSGVIVNSREEKIMLSEADEGYARFSTAKRIKQGDLFVIYRVEGKVEHPVTGKTMGYKVRYIGLARVTSTEKAVAKIYFLRSYEELFREDRLAPYAPMVRSVVPIRNATTVAGNIIATFDDVRILGEYHYVVIDRGSKDGVMPGNRFVIRERGDGIPALNPRKLDEFPYEINGEVLIIETQENTSLGIITYARSEFYIGAPCDMLAGY